MSLSRNYAEQAEIVTELVVLDGPLDQQECDRFQRLGCEHAALSNDRREHLAALEDAMKGTVAAACSV